MLDGVGGFVKMLLKNRLCPSCLQVRDPELAAYLRDRLAATGIEVALTDRLPALDAAVAELTAMVGSMRAGPPAMMDIPNMTLEQMRSFAAAAAEFYRAAPWRHLTDVDLIQVESPKPPRGMAHLNVLGAGRSTYGLAIYPSRAAFENFFRAGQAGDYDGAVTSGLAQVLFEVKAELAPADAALWDEYQLPVAGDEAYPSAVKYLARGKAGCFSSSELDFLDGLLRALAATTEDDIDTGRWQKEVVTHDGPAKFVLAIPDLLAPPSPQEWMKRGHLPDTRSHERMFADMNRLLEEHPPTSRDALEKIGQLYAGRSIDNPLTQPRSPAERAQDLCFQAFDARGRRRVQLARQALQMDPDCCDAHVILAEHAGTLAGAIDHYRLGMEAAKRQLGPACFAEDEGHFWGISRTRPYMRARFGLAESLREAGRLDEAIEHFQDLLRLNPEDNQGVRFVLLPELLAAGRDVDAARLLEQCDEQSAHWAYARALLAFRVSGRSPAADRELRAALRLNSHVPALLLSDEPIPQPGYYYADDYDEACIVAEALRPAFEATPGAIMWISEVFQQREKKLDKLRREKRRKERAAKKNRKRR